MLVWSIHDILFAMRDQTGSGSSLICSALYSAAGALGQHVLTVIPIVWSPRNPPQPLAYERADL